MPKKRDKFKTIGSEMRLKNISVSDLDDIYYFETSQNTRIKSSKVHLEKGKQSLKTNVKLVKGRVIEVMANNRYSVVFAERCSVFGVRCSDETDTPNTDPKTCSLSGRLKYLAHETRNPICVGDFVNVDTSDPTNLRIEEILPRKNLLSRRIDRKTVLFASNIDQVVIVASVAEPEFKATLIDRYICIAELSNIPVIICVNKVDLDERCSVFGVRCSEDEANIPKTEDRRPKTDECSYYTQMGYKVIYTSVTQNIGINELKELLKDKETLFTGHSGTGKSSLINALQPGLDLRVGDVSDYHSKGMHTTTNSRMIAWDFGGFLIDSPGIKILGLHNDDLPLIAKCFPGFAKWADKCAFANCTHTHEELCAIKDKVGKEIPEDRYISYINLRKYL